MRFASIVASPFTLLIQKIENLKFLDRELKKSKKEYEALKNEICSSALKLNINGDINNDLGHTLATYKDEADNRFDKKRFELVYPGIYETFIITGSKKVFRLKP